MEDLKLVEKLVIVPETLLDRRRLFLSNIDLTLVTYLETVSFIEPTSNDISFAEICCSLYRALGRILVSYDFMAGRLIHQVDEGANDRYEIDCNGEGVVVVAATTTSEISPLRELRSSNKPEFRKLVSFLRDEEWMNLDLKEKPLLLLQLTRFQCGGVALASLSNHCTLDGTAIQEFIVNLASLTRGEDLVVQPNSDRSIFKARNLPRICHPHFEYSIPKVSDTSFSIPGSSILIPGIIKQPLLKSATKLVYLSESWISNLKTSVLRDGKFMNYTTFHVVAAKLWKARSIAVQLQDECISTILFPIDVRRKIVPRAPKGFAGNALIPGFARLNMSRIKTEKFSTLVDEIHKGVERVDDDYVKSNIDWLEVNRGVPCRENSFSVVVWSKLGFEGVDFGWGRITNVVPIEIKPGLVIVLPGHTEGGGVNICLELPSEQMEEFYKLMMAKE